MAPGTGVPVPVLTCTAAMPRLAVSPSTPRPSALRVSERTGLVLPMPGQVTTTVTSL